MAKVILRFDPTPRFTPEECERHYLEVHVPMAQDLLRPMPALLSYHMNRALAEADVRGGWHQRPRAWRFVVLRFSDGETLAFTPEQDEIVYQDHRNFLHRLRICEVEEQVLFDRAGAVHSGMAKFLLEADRGDDIPPEEAWAALRAAGERVRAHMAESFGARRLILNRAISEAECEPLDEERQRPIGLLPQTTRVGYIECWFDHRRWGEEALGALVGDGILGNAALADAHLLLVADEAAIENRR